MTHRPRPQPRTPLRERVDGPVIRARLATRVLVVAPANLVKNWASEFNQWVGKGVLSVVALSPDDATGVRAADRRRAVGGRPRRRPGWARFSIPLTRADVRRGACVPKRDTRI